MTTLPQAMAMIAILVTTTFVSAQNADFNNDNVIDAYDLLLLTSNLNQSCDSNCPSDLNNDGVTDVSDMMILIGQWGPVGNGDQASNSSSDSVQSTPRNHDLSWQNEAPVLLDAIYYDQYTELFSHGGYDRWHTAQVHNQGEHAKAWTQENNVEVLPMVYGAVDWDHDDELTEEDKANFLIWLEATVPADYSGPLCLDLEGPWWPLLDSSNQAVVDTAIDFFIENIEYAKAQRPNAKIGFWGFPKKSHTNANSNTASVQRLVNACTALFPDVYENNPGGNDSSRLQQHVEKCIEMVNGEAPVYVQASPRYKMGSSGYRYMHDRDEFIRDQVQPAMNASWTDADGKTHQVSGIALWDAYTYVRMYTDGYSAMSGAERKVLWNELDLMHVDYLSDMKVVVDDAVSAFNQAQAATEAEAQAAAEATQVAAAAVESEREAQVSRLTRRLDNAKNRVIVRSKSYRSKSKRYRAARKAWAKAKRAFTKAKSKYGRNSKQYKSAIAAYRKAQGKMRASARIFKKARTAYKVARTQRNNAQNSWNAANSQWSAMASASSMLASQ